MPELPEDIDGFSLKDLAETAIENFDVGSDCEVPPLTRFRMGVTRMLKKRLMRVDSAQDPRHIAVFLLGKPPNLKNKILSTKPFADDGSSVLAGRLWFVNEAVHSAMSLPLSIRDAGAIRTYIVDTLGHGNSAAVVLNTDADPIETRFYPKGLADLDNVIIDTLDDEVANEHEVAAVVDRVYRNALKTPDVQRAPYCVWAEPATYRPISRAEETLAAFLLAAIQGRYYKTHRLKREMNVEEGGRVDIAIVRPDITRGVHQVDCVLELKVLRSHWSSGAAVSDKVTQDHVEEGVEQAYYYREQEIASVGALYCFDMRRGDWIEGQCFTHVKAKADELNVTLRDWRLFNTTGAARQHKVAVRLDLPKD